MLAPRDANAKPSRREYAIPTVVGRIGPIVAIGCCCNGGASDVARLPCRANVKWVL